MTLLPKQIEVPVKVFDLLFFFQDSCLQLQDEKRSTKALLTTCRSVLDSFSEINHLGYFPSTFTKNVFYLKFEEILKQKIKKFSVIGASETTYRLWYNYILLELLHQIEKIEFFDPHHDELQEMRQTIINRLDSYLKFQIQRRSITILQNTYTGFDTEFELENEKKHLNKLLSIQLANQTRTLIKIPLYSILDLSYIHPLTSEISQNSEQISEDSQVSESQVLNASLKTVISKIRNAKDFNSCVNISFSLIDLLKTVQGIKWYEDHKRDQIVFAFPLTPLRSRIFFPDGGMSLKKVIAISNDLSSLDLLNSLRSLTSTMDGMDFEFNSRKIIS